MNNTIKSLPDDEISFRFVADNTDTFANVVAQTPGAIILIKKTSKFMAIDKMK